MSKAQKYFNVSSTSYANKTYITISAMLNVNKKINAMMILKNATQGVTKKYVNIL